MTNNSIIISYKEIQSLLKFCQENNRENITILDSPIGEIYLMTQDNFNNFYRNEDRIKALRINITDYENF